MQRIKGMLKNLFESKKITIIQETQNGDTSFNNNSIGNVHNGNNEYHVHIHGDSATVARYESVIGEDSSVELREAILPIEDMINDGKFELAIRKYNEMIGAENFAKHTRNEKFLVYIGLFNCHISNGSPDDVTNRWATKIQALGDDVKELHRFYYLMAVREYMKQEFEKAQILVNQSLKMKSDYVNACSLNVLLKSVKGEINYEEASLSFEEMINTAGQSVKEYSVIHSCYGDAAYYFKDYTMAKLQYSKSNQFIRGLMKEIAIAVCEYFLSFEAIKENGRVDMNKINFATLRIAEEKFDAIYNKRTEESIHTIILRGFSFYFNILTLTNNHRKILSIYEETKDKINDSMTGLLYFVVESQVAHGILDHNKISLFNEYEQIKFEAVYLDKTEAYDDLISMLIPVMEKKHAGDKVLQLYLLNAFKEKDDFESYISYYQKFSCNQDEVMRMNYIQFLMKRNQKEQALLEVEKLKPVVSNGLVLLDLLQIYIENHLYSDLDEFFSKIDSGEYRVVGIHIPLIFYRRMMYLLNSNRNEEFSSLYESSDLSNLNDRQRVILEINYCIVKGDFEGLSRSYYEYFLLSNDYNDLLSAVEIKLQINRPIDAEIYLEQINPMELDAPEYYYIFKAIILREKKLVKEALEILDEGLGVLELDNESPFHQFYTAFNMNNGRTDEAFRYMSEFYLKNPNPSWFKTIQLSENESGSELLSKLEAAAGGRRDLTLINRYFSEGIFGISIYSVLTGTSVDEILLFTHYPYTKMHISRGATSDAKSKIVLVDRHIIVDSTTMMVLAASGGLQLLSVFDEILMPYSAIQSLVQRKASTFKANAERAIDFINMTPSIKRLPIEACIKINAEDIQLLSEDILDCISLSENMGVPFLNTEVAVDYEFKLNTLIDINVLFAYLKEKHPSMKDQISMVIAKMKEMNFEFVSFNADDMYCAFLTHGIEGISPFLKMGINADYNTFSAVYISFLYRLKCEQSEEIFELSAGKIIDFMDMYVGKMRYYIYSLISKHPQESDVLTEIIRKPSVKGVMQFNLRCNIGANSSYSYDMLMNSYEFKKIMSISASFIMFIIQFTMLFKDNGVQTDKYIDFIKQRICINNGDDIDYILDFGRRMQQTNADIN